MKGHKKKGWTIWRSKASICPYCGTTLDAHGPHNDPPLAGDVTICVHCVAILVFDAQLQLRKATNEEFAEAMALPEVSRIVASLLELQEQEGN